MNDRVIEVDHGAGYSRTAGGEEKELVGGESIVVGTHNFKLRGSFVWDVVMGIGDWELGPGSRNRNR